MQSSMPQTPPMGSMESSTACIYARWLSQWRPLQGHNSLARPEKQHIRVGSCRPPREVSYGLVRLRDQAIHSRRADPRRARNEPPCRVARDGRRRHLGARPVATMREAAREQLVGDQPRCGGGAGSGLENKVSRSRSEHRICDRCPLSCLERYPTRRLFKSSSGSASSQYGRHLLRQRIFCAWRLRQEMGPTALVGDAISEWLASFPPYFELPLLESGGPALGRPSVSLELNARTPTPIGNAPLTSSAVARLCVGPPIAQHMRRMTPELLGRGPPIGGGAL